MNDNLILIITIIGSAVIGAYLGMLFTKLKSKGEKSTLEERQKQLNNIIEDLKVTTSNLELDRDKYRDEREGLNLELVQKNTEFENLQHQEIHLQFHLHPSHTLYQNQLQLPIITM